MSLPVSQCQLSILLQARHKGAERPRRKSKSRAPDSETLRSPELAAPKVGKASGGRPRCASLVAFHRKGGQQSALRFRIAWKLQTYRRLSLKEKTAFHATGTPRTVLPATAGASWRIPSIDLYCPWIVSSFRRYFRLLAEISMSLEHSVEVAGRILRSTSNSGYGHATL